MPVSIKPSTIPPHPGELFARLMNRYRVTRYRCAQVMNVPHRHVYDLTHCRRAVTPLMAARLGRMFDMPPEDWLAAQGRFDLAQVEIEYADQLNAIVALASPDGNPGSLQ